MNFFGIKVGSGSKMLKIIMMGVSFLHVGSNIGLKLYMTAKMSFSHLRCDTTRTRFVKILLLYTFRENMPSHFKFKEYCPIVFRNLRERFNIDDECYMVSYAGCGMVLEWDYSMRVQIALPSVFNVSSHRFNF